MDFPYRCKFAGGGYDLRHATLKGRNKKVKADLDSQHGNGATKSANSLSSCYHEIDINYHKLTILGYTQFLDNQKLNGSDKLR